MVFGESEASETYTRLLTTALVTFRSFGAKICTAMHLVSSATSPKGDFNSDGILTPADAVGRA